jgi:hypothetical protein
MEPDPDADPGPFIFVTDLQDANKNLIFKKSFPVRTVHYFFKVPVYTSFSKIKSQKDVRKQ